MLSVDYRAVVSRSDLVYQSPVIRPVEGQPIGNGRMGTLVWTTPGAINLQINRVDVFAVNKNHAGKRDGPADYCGGCAKVTIDVGGSPFDVGKPFQQKLSLYDAQAMVAGDGVSVRCFVSSVSDVLALEVDDQRAEPQPVRVKVSMWRPPEVKNGKHTAGYKFEDKKGKVSIVQKFTEGDHYCGSAAAAMVAGGGTQIETSSDRERIITAPARKGKTTVLISSAASFSPKDNVGAAALELLEEASKHSYDELFTEHTRWWSDFWSGTFVDVTSADGVGEFMGAVRHLHLYYMASTSRGALPAKWNCSVFSTEGDVREWGAQFWVWTTEISHYPLHAADASDLADPWFNMYVNQLPDAEKAARQRWDAKGAYFLETGPFDGPVVLPPAIGREYQDVYLGRKTVKDLSPAALSLGQYESVLTQFADGHSERGEAGRYSYCSHIASSGSEVALQAWWRYRYTGDKQWLRSHAYPLLRGTVEFYRHLATKGEDGLYHLHGLNQHEGFWGVNDGLTDLAAIRGTAPLAIRAAEILDTDAELRVKWQEFLENLAPYPMGSDPESVGVSADDIWSIGHKGPSDHVQTDPDEGLMWPIFPFEDWTLETRDARTDHIAQKYGQTNSLRKAILSGNEFYSGSSVRTPIVGSRLGRGDELPLVLAGYYYAYKPLPNGMSRFEGATAESIEVLGSVSTALQEGLLQSLSPHPGEPEIISVFPAWPKEWGVSFRLLARGGFLVTSAVQNGEVEFVEIESRLGEPCRLRNPWGTPCLVTEVNGAVSELSGDILSFDTGPGRQYRILAKGSPESSPRRISPESATEAISYSLFGRNVELSEAFCDPASLDGWEIKSGKPKIEDGVLNTGDVPLEMCTRKKFSIPLRIEYTIRAENPSDYSAYLGDSPADGLFLQLAGQQNTMTRVGFNGETLVMIGLRDGEVADVVPPGQWQRVLWDITNSHINLQVNGKQLLYLKLPAGLEIGERPLGLFIYKTSQLCNVRVCSPKRRCEYEERVSWF